MSMRRGPVSRWVGVATGVVALVAAGIVTNAQSALADASGTPPHILDLNVVPAQDQPALLDFESTAAHEVLADHSLPPTGLTAVMGWGRDQVRAQMWADLLANMAKGDQDRTPQEQTVYSWFQGIVQQQDIAAAQAGVDEYLKWSGLSADNYVDNGMNPVAYNADSTAGYCVYHPPAPYTNEYLDGNPEVNYYPCLHPNADPALWEFPTPTYDQFVKYGEYDALQKQTSTAGFVGIDVDTSASLAMGVSMVAATVAAPIVTSLTTGLSLTTGSVGAEVMQEVFPYAVRAAAKLGGLAVDGVGELIGLGSMLAGAIASVVASVIELVVMAVTSGIFIDTALKLPQQLHDNLTTAQNTAPDLHGVVHSGGASQIQQLFTTFLTTTLPLADPEPCDDGGIIVGGSVYNKGCVNAPVPAMVQASDPVFEVVDPKGSTTDQRYIDVVPSDGATSTTRASGNGWFVNTVNGTTSQSLQMTYQDWSGNYWFAQRIWDPTNGYRFVRTPIDDNEADCSSGCVGKSIHFVDAKTGGTEVATIVDPPPGFGGTITAPTGPVFVTQNITFAASDPSSSTTYYWYFPADSSGEVNFSTGNALEFAVPGPFTYPDTGEQGEAVFYEGHVQGAFTTTGEHTVYLQAGDTWTKYTIDVVPDTRKSQTITVDLSPPADGLHVGDTVPVSATASSGLPVDIFLNPSRLGEACTYSGATGEITGVTPGYCYLDFTQTGDSTYKSAARVEQELTVMGEVTVEALPETIHYGEKPTYGYSISDPSAFYDTTHLTCTGPDSPDAGVYRDAITCSGGLAGDVYQVKYQPADLTVLPAQQTITVTSPDAGSGTVGGTYVPSGTSDSGLAVQYSIDSSTTGDACSFDGTMVHYDHAGTCVVDFTQPGNHNYLAASPTSMSIAVNAIPTATTLTADQGQPVYGQPISLSAATTAGAPGTVQFAVDGADVGSPVVDDGGHAAVDLPGPLAPGVHTVTAAFTPDDPTVYSASSATATISVAQAATAMQLSVRPRKITATLTAVAPGSGIPTGTVRFETDGQALGTARLRDGVATLRRRLPPGVTHRLSAVYSGDADYTGSSASTARRDPQIRAVIHSARRANGYGWYRTPVTVRFVCRTAGAPLLRGCPAAVTLSRNGAARSITRTIQAADGGAATVSVAGINIDRTAPRGHVRGVREGATYPGSAPVATCVGRDALSGVASCVLTAAHLRHGVARVTATITDQAGNRTSSTVRYRVLSTYLDGARYSRGAFDVRPGHEYTVVVAARHRPRYFDAAVYPRRPAQPDNPFCRAAGRHRWALGVAIDRTMRSHPLWYLGVQFDGKLHRIKVRIV